ncbi:hypothetical protein WDU99_12100 [Microbacterium sp. Mu-80]|uniref:Uncharacterized protein n=1 Tax=Microbacterium bandirmense TaxID=3122050 RepID=A0ABU8LDF6_9MICO
MTLKYIGGTLPGWGVYSLTTGLLVRVPSGQWELNAETVSSVEVAGAGKEYNYAAGGAGMLAGAAVAGPVGMLVGGLLPKAFKDDVVQFVIRFRDGNVAHFAGSPGDYKRALKSSYKPTLATSQPNSNNVAITSETSEIEQLRAEVAALRSEKRPAAPMTQASAPTPATAAPEPVVRAWFEGFPECLSEPPADGESTEERKHRESLNKKHRKEYRSALKEKRKQFEREIRKSTINPVKRVQMISEMHKEYYALENL